MNWFFIALITPLVHSFSNFIDKFLLSKYFQHYKLPTLIVYSSVSAVFLLPVFLIAGNFQIFGAGLRDILLLMLAGISAISAVYFYLYALSKDDASVVVPFFQLVPVLSYMLGYVFLKETLNQYQLVGSLIIILGAVVLSLEIEDGKKIRIKHHVAITMFLASLLYALEGIIFKFVAVGEDFWISNFWEYVGIAFVGVMIIVFGRGYRVEFMDSLRKHKAKITAINFLSEGLTLGGYLSLNWAFLLAPVALVRVVEGYQPVFVLILGFLITKLFPEILTEKMHWKHMVQKFASILIILLGSYYVLV